MQASQSRRYGDDDPSSAERRSRQKKAGFVGLAKVVADGSREGMLSGESLVTMAGLYRIGLTIVRSQCALPRWSVMGKRTGEVD
jgi:hypothetical protein